MKKKHMYDFEKLREDVKKFMNDHRLTNKEIAEEIGYDPSILSKWFSKDPYFISMNVAYRLVKKIGTNLNDYLLYTSIKKYGITYDYFDNLSIEELQDVIERLNVILYVKIDKEIEAKYMQINELHKNIESLNSMRDKD